MDRCTGCRDITEILLKMELNTIQSINPTFKALNKMVSSERRMNFVAMTIINPEETGQAQDWASDPPPPHSLVHYASPVCYWPIYLGFSLILGKILAEFDLFPDKPLFLNVCSSSLFKTLWEKKKLLVTSNFSFSCSVFYPFAGLSTGFIKFWIVIFKLF